IYKSCDSITWEKIDNIAITRKLHIQKIQGLKDGRSGEWIADIDREMEKMRKREQALYDYQIIVFEIKETARIKKELEAASAKNATESNVVVPAPTDVVAAISENNIEMAVEEIAAAPIPEAATNAAGAVAL
ncbi:hypothetical protein PENTCL1PPCAC_10201, partial [Pristionchus entomophagus]